VHVHNLQAKALKELPIAVLSPFEGKELPKDDVTLRKVSNRTSFIADMSDM
jgi:hypothetical protein